MFLYNSVLELVCVLCNVSIFACTVYMLQGIRFKKIAPPNAERLAASAAEDAIK